MEVREGCVVHELGYVTIRHFDDPVELYLEAVQVVVRGTPRIIVEAYVASGSDQGENWGTLSVYVKEGVGGFILADFDSDSPGSLGEDEIIAKDYSENATWVPQVLEAMPDRFIKTGKYAMFGFACCPIYKVVLDS